MSTHLTTLLGDRAVLLFQGADVFELFQGLVTVDMERLSDGGNVFGALLAPQGKIQFDFFIHKRGEHFFIDIDNSLAADFLKRMTLYRLRSDVSFEDVSETFKVLVSWGEGAAPPFDARLIELGTRTVTDDHPETNAGQEDYHAHRIHLGVPEAGKDFTYDDVFPHDAMMDALGGVNFDKGCYVGQEVVSRVQHRGTGRKRFHIVSGDGPLADRGTPVMAGDKTIGVMGSSSGQKGLGLLRIDHLEKTTSDLTVDKTNVTATLPDYFASLQPEDA